MSYKKITAVVRCTELKDVERCLQEAGVAGLTISHVRGYGEHVNPYRDDWTVKHARLEIFAGQDDVARTVDVISPRRGLYRRPQRGNVRVPADDLMPTSITGIGYPCLFRRTRSGDAFWPWSDHRGRHK